MPRVIRKVALLIDTARECGRGFLRGIIEYQNSRGAWSLFFQPRGPGDPPSAWLARWKGDGIIVRADSLAMGRAVQRSGLPAVDLSLRLPNLGIPYVCIDSVGITQMAFEHLRDQGYRHFAHCGYPSGENPWGEFREKCLAKIVREYGASFSAFPARRIGGRLPSWEREQSDICRWLSRLPRPVGILTSSDERGLQVVDACRRLNLHVPDEVGVIGAENDDYTCNLASPPLSSVSPGLERAGFEAAAMLDGLMDGRKPKVTQILLPPMGVVARRSTDMAAAEDPEVSRLIRFLRDHACRGLRVEELWKQSDLSPSHLQRRLRAQLGRTPKEEIHRVQLERAKSLLVFSDLSVAAIAGQCGFSQTKHLSRLFQEKVGLSPRDFRAQSHGQGGDKKLETLYHPQRFQGEHNRYNAVGT